MSSPGVLFFIQCHRQTAVYGKTRWPLSAHIAAHALYRPEEESSPSLMTTFVIYDVEENIPLGLGLPLELYLPFFTKLLFTRKISAYAEKNHIWK
jgi:hypothetical protein